MGSDYPRKDGCVGVEIDLAEERAESTKRLAKRKPYLILLGNFSARLTKNELRIIVNEGQALLLEADNRSVYGAVERDLG
jgi:hypothetical protein